LLFADEVREASSRRVRFLVVGARKPSAFVV
jgi:hypothetical protein